MASIPDLKKRIINIKTTAKLTKAVQLMAIIKLRKAERRVARAQVYFQEVYATFSAIIAASHNPLYQTTTTAVSVPPHPTLWLVINSDMGLCGGYNLNVNHLVLPHIAAHDLIYVIGKKGASFFTSQKPPLYKTQLGVTINFSFSDAQLIGAEILALYHKQEIGTIKLVYTKFINHLRQQPAILQLLPIVKTDFKPVVQAESEFEPDPEVVLTTTLPFYLNSVIMGAVTESKLSEQAARRMAMDGASRNADQLIHDLTVVYNRKRQQKITQEIIEIINGISDR